MAKLAAANPFSPGWTALEAAALGSSFRPRARPWSLLDDEDARRHNHEGVEALAAEYAPRLRPIVVAADASDDDCALYRELSLFDLYTKSIEPLDALVAQFSPKRVAAYTGFKAAFADAFDDVDVRARPAFDVAHAFAGFFQIRRAFTQIFRFIVGSSRVTAGLRATIWEAIFSADATRYRRALVDRMRDVSVLILGPTGTGKELVARAIGRSGFVPFVEERACFAGDPDDAFFPVHLSAMSETLIESALFGHRKGAFTGAVADRQGLFAGCPPWGTVFLDEVGELDPALQTKLLRVLETRDFSAVGADDHARFVGRVIAATHRAVDDDANDAFRRDLYYRLSGVVVKTPSLHERVSDDERELSDLVRFVSRAVAGDDEADALADDVLAGFAARKDAARAYAWPGNVRELTQLVRTVMIHGQLPDHAFAAHRSPTSQHTPWLDDVVAGRLSVDDVVGHYVCHVYDDVGSYDGAARRLGVARRAERARVAARRARQLDDDAAIGIEVLRVRRTLA